MKHRDTILHIATLRRRIELTSNIVSLTFYAKTLPIPVPGQFYLIGFKKNKMHEAREYSIANSVYEKNIVEFGILHIPHGNVSPKLHNLQIGDSVILKGPMGKYFNWDYEFNNDVIFIAGGVGLVPFMSMLRSGFDNPFTLLGSFKTEMDIPYRSELQNSLNKKFKMHITLTREKNSSYEYGRISHTFLIKHITKKQQHEGRFFICGGSQFVEDMHELLLHMGVSESQIQRERFG